MKHDNSAGSSRQGSSTVNYSCESQAFTFHDMAQTEFRSRSRNLTLLNWIPVQWSHITNRFCSVAVSPEDKAVDITSLSPWRNQNPEPQKTEGNIATELSEKEMIKDLVLDKTTIFHLGCFWPAAVGCLQPALLQSHWFGGRNLLSFLSRAVPSRPAAPGHPPGTCGTEIWGHRVLQVTFSRSNLPRCPLGALRCQGRWAQCGAAPPVPTFAPCGVSSVISQCLFSTPRVVSWDIDQ